MLPLVDLPVLIVDCQATGPASAGGHLLEIGWLKVPARDAGDAEPEAATSLRLRIPEGASIPPHVQRITGLSGGEAAGLGAGEAWNRMVEGLGAGPIPAIAHYARFERPFLLHLHRKMSPNRPFPFQIVCTHEVVRRLLPDLPRKGLRAVAGYFDYGVKEQRRCAAHVAATARIWFHLCRLLRDECAVHTWPDLLAWLETTPVPAVSRRFAMDLSQIDRLPDQPGIYRMHRESGALLYVGKAASLRKRVASYFRPRARHPEHILEMLTQARGVETAETGSSLEAALAEVDEIHRFSPPYNRALRPDGRNLWFAAPDFSRIAPDLNEGCPIGPLPDERTAAALSALARIWESAAAVELAAASLGVSTDRVPDRDTFRAGIEFFQFRHGPGRAPAHRRLKVLARRLWEEKKTAAAETIDANQEMDNDPQKPVEENADWTPETVSGRLESMLCHGGRMLRRARWLVLLSEATLVWRGVSEVDARRLMVFEKGRPCKVGHLAASRQIPVPPGHRRPMDRRRAHIDLTAYDRLRVLTTELRRLLCEGRDPVLRLSDPTTLGPAQLARALFWF